MSMLSELSEIFPDLFDENNDVQSTVTFNMEPLQDSIITDDSTLISGTRHSGNEGTGRQVNSLYMDVEDVMEVTDEDTEPSETNSLEEYITALDELVVVMTDISEDVDDEEEEEEAIEEEIQENNGEEEILPAVEQTTSEDAFPTVERADVARERFKGAPWFQNVKNKEVTLIGLGGIGSWVNLLVSRLNVRHMIHYDFDHFEDHNMAGQLVSKIDVNRPKSYVAQQIAYMYGNYSNISSYNRRFRYQSPISKVVICGFDNMEGRKDAFLTWKSSFINNYVNKKEYLFIDGRLSSEMFQVFVIQGDDNYAIQKYEEDWLFDDTDADLEDCTFKQTSHMAAMIASYITMYFVNWCNNEDIRNLPRRIPWFTEFNAVLNTHKYEY